VADLMAFCNKCGYSFHSGFSLGANSTVSNCGSACPNCKNVVTLNAQTDENGNFKNFSKLAFATLTAASFPIYDLEKLKDLIKVKPNKSDISSERELVEVIKQEIPELDELTNLLVPTNAGEFYGFLSFLLALVTFIIVMRGSNKEPSQTIINNFYGASEPENEAYKAAYEQSAIKRKDLCPCGSGKKFKNCHGE
jgi:hypothetical protein